MKAPNIKVPRSIKCTLGKKEQIAENIQVTTAVQSFLLGITKVQALSHNKTVNSLPTNDGKCRHDLCELSISLWEFIWGF